MQSLKTVLITGCSSGFGYLTALKFSRNNYYTFASVRNPNSTGAKKLQEIAQKESLPLEIIQIDVQNEISIKKAIDYIKKQKKLIDILVNNAGYGYLGTIEETTIEEIKALYGTNIFGVIRMIQAVVPIMRKQQSGLIVNLSSINGIIPFPLFSIYSTTKFAIETLTEGLRFELKHFGIDVVAVEPGSFLTNFSKNRQTPKTLHSKASPYYGLINNFFKRYEQTHRTGDKSATSKTADPQEVADTIYTIAHTTKPRLRYLVGGDAYKFYYLRKILPAFIWEWLLHKIYKW